MLEDLNNTNCCNLKNNQLQIGDDSPRFTANSTYGPLKLCDYIGKWLIFFSYPEDFTPVCTTEIIEFSNLYKKLKEKNCELLGISVNNTSSHISWLKNIYENTGIKINFPIISDIDMNISKLYNMICPKISNTQTARYVYFIDPNQKIRAIFAYPENNGRNMQEILRLLDAMILSDNENILTPANWLYGNSTILNTPIASDYTLNYNKNMTKCNCNNNYTY